jgi:hypothetical protein
MEEFPLEWSKDGDLSADRPSKGGTLTLEDGRVNCRALHTIRLWVEALPTGLLWHEYRREQYNSENGRKAFETPNQATSELATLTASLNSRSRHCGS